MKNNFWKKLPKPFFALAPMADVTDVVFRNLVAKYSRHGEGGGGPDVLRLVLDPAGGREMLREFLLRHGGNGNVGAEHDGARGGGALIDGEDKGHWSDP